MYRFAPSPTGDMHIGNLRAAIFNYMCAKKYDKSFHIRIEDTDKARNIDGKDSEILEILKTFGLDYSQLYYQGHNLKFHHQFASKLLMEKKAFSCFCTPEELEQKREKAKKEGKAYRYDGACEKLSDKEVLNNEKPFVVRIKMPNHTICFNDAIKGKLCFERENIDSFVILREDKTPTYNFACTIDDLLQGVRFVIRGEDHVSNTPKQLHIRESLGFTESIEFAHLPIILNDEGKKMSKRDDASSVKWLLEEGFLPSAIANYLILLGNKTPCEIFTMSEAIEWFELENISKSPARFDITKLRQLNREHIKMLDNAKLGAMVGYSGEDFGLLVKLFTEEGSTLNEIKPKIDAIFAKKESFGEFDKEVELIKEVIKTAPYFEEYNDFKNHISTQTSLKGKYLFKPLRIILSGAEHGPELEGLYRIIKNYIKEIAR